MIVQDSPIFIGGSRHSGVELIGSLLDSHPRIACAIDSGLLRETSIIAFHHYFRGAWKSHIKRYGLQADTVDALFGAFANDIFTRLAHSRGKPRWAEGTCDNEHFLDFMFLLFPDALFVHMVRDPRDIYYSRIHQGDDNHERTTAEELGNEWSRAISTTLPRSRDMTHFLRVKYEDLVQAPQHTMQRVLAFVGEQWTDPTHLDNIAEVSKGNMQLDRLHESTGLWERNLPPQVVRWIEDAAGVCMERAGYTLTSLDQQPPCSPPSNDVDE